MREPDERKGTPDVWTDLLRRGLINPIPPVDAVVGRSWRVDREITLCIDSMELQMMGIKPC